MSKNKTNDSSLRHSNNSIRTEASGGSSGSGSDESQGRKNRVNSPPPLLAHSSSNVRVVSQNKVNRGVGGSTGVGVVNTLSPTRSNASGDNSNTVSPPPTPTPKKLSSIPRANENLKLIDHGQQDANPLRPMISPAYQGHYPSLRSPLANELFHRNGDEFDSINYNFNSIDNAASTTTGDGPRGVNGRNEASNLARFGKLIDTEMSHASSYGSQSNNLQIFNDPLYSSTYTIQTSPDIESLLWREIIPYYLPFLSWVHKYCLNYFIGDLIGGLTLIVFQLPLCLSYATSLAKVPVKCGLLSLGISPLIYLFFGSVPQMIVGPEAPILLIVGQAVEPLLHHAQKHNLDPVEYVVAITFVSGASLLGFGLGRFGFLDNVLSASLLKGFICGVGFVMIINSSVSMLGLTALMKEISDDPLKMDIHSPLDKLYFLFHYYHKMNFLSFKISIIGFVAAMVSRYSKKVFAKSNKRLLKFAIYFPEIMVVVGTATILCHKYAWNERDIDIIGSIPTGSIDIYSPFNKRILVLMKQLSTSGFLCAMLGFFESTTASKSLGTAYDLPISSNRELVALGSINIVGSLFGALPAFGGYGRSKINAISAKTTMLGAIMGICTLLTVKYLLSYLFYVPICMLSVVTAIIGLLLIEEAPGEVLFHYRARGYNELVTFFVTVTATLVFSMEAGISVGLVYLLIRVIKHGAESRIQILGRQPGTNSFVNADIPSFTRTLFDDDNLDDMNQLNMFIDLNFTTLNTQAIEEIQGCLIVKIPEPLTFMNTSDLRSRLKRLELYGSAHTHPGHQRMRGEDMTKYVIFDLQGMIEFDSSAAQILKGLINGYIDRGIICFFVRVHPNIRLRSRLLNTGIFDLLVDMLIKLEYFSRIDRLQIEFSDVDEELNNLTESVETPYFLHISDALKAIDYYELNMMKSGES